MNEYEQPPNWMAVVAYVILALLLIGACTVIYWIAKLLTLGV